MHEHRKAYLILHIVSIFTFGIALIVVSYLPLNELKALFDSFAPDGDFESFSIKYVMLIRSTGIFICIVGGLVYIFRKKVLQYMPDFKITDFLINPKNILGFVFNFIRDIKEAVRKEDKIHIYTFILLILLAIAVRIYYLNQPFFSDETKIFESKVYHSYGLKGLIDSVTRYYTNGDHMFQTFLSYLTYKLLGSEQYMWTYRMPALIAGILLVPATYMVVRIIYNKYAALLASGIAAASSFLILYSTLARGHSMISLFFFLILALGAYLKRNNNLVGWHLFAILSALGFYTIPLMLYPYGVVVTWLMLSIIIEETHLRRSSLVKNLFISMIITVLLTLLLYSPIFLFGTGLKSIIYLYVRMISPPFSNYMESFLIMSVFIWHVWSENVPDIIILFFVIGFFISLLFHKKLSIHRINIALAACISFIPIIVLRVGVLLQPRYLISIFLLGLVLASSGLTYLISLIEKVFGNHKSAMYSVLAMIVSIFLIGNTVQDKPYHLTDRMHFFDETGKYTDFSFIIDSLSHHQVSELYGMNLNLPEGLYAENLTADIFGKALPPENYMNLYFMPKSLIIFKSQSENDFWMKGLDNVKRRFSSGYVNSDLNSYLSKYSRICHSLFLISSESIPDLEDLLDKKGISVSDYSSPELIHRYKYANLYKITRTKNCMKYNAMEKKAVKMAYDWKLFISEYKSIMGRFPGDSDNDGLIGNALKEQALTTPAAALDNIPILHKNPIAIGNYQFWVYIGYDSTNTNKNVMVICKTADCADGTKFTKDELKLIEAIDTAFDGILDAGRGQFRASTKVVLLPDFPVVDGWHTSAVTAVTAIDETSAGSSTTWATSHNSAVWLFDRPY